MENKDWLLWGIVIAVIVLIIWGVIAFNRARNKVVPPTTSIVEETPVPSKETVSPSPTYDKGK